MPACSPMPRPVLPMVPSEWASSTKQHRAVLRLDVDKAREVGKVAVHAVDALDGDEDAPEAVADAREQRVERAPVVVRESAAGRARKPRALQDRVVGEDVVDDEVARTHQVPDRRDVGRVPRDEDDRRGRAEKCGERAFELAMDLLFAGDEAARTRAGAVAIDRGLRRGSDGRVVRHADIVVGAEVRQLATVDAGDPAARGRCLRDVALIDAKVRVAFRDGQHHALVALELEVFGEERDVVVLRGDRARGGVGIRVVDQVLLHGGGEVAEGDRLAVDDVGKVPAEALVERGDELDALQRIEAECCNRGIGRDVGEDAARHGERMLADGGERGGLHGRYARGGHRLPAALGKGLEFVGEECGATGVALDLAAGCPGDRAAADQHDRIEREAVLVEYRGVHGVDDRGQVDTGVALHFVHEDEALGAILLDGEGGAEAGLRAADGIRAPWLRCPADGG